MGVLLDAGMVLIMIPLMLCEEAGVQPGFFMPAIWVLDGLTANPRRFSSTHEMLIIRLSNEVGQADSAAIAASLGKKENAETSPSVALCRLVATSSEGLLCPPAMSHRYPTEIPASSATRFRSSLRAFVSHRCISGTGIFICSAFRRDISNLSH